MDGVRTRARDRAIPWQFIEYFRATWTWIEAIVGHLTQLDSSIVLLGSVSKISPSNTIWRWQCYIAMFQPYYMPTFVYVVYICIPCTLYNLYTQVTHGTSGPVPRWHRLHLLCTPKNIQDLIKDQQHKPHRSQEQTLLPTHTIRSTCPMNTKHGDYTGT